MIYSGKIRILRKIQHCTFMVVAVVAVAAVVVLTRTKGFDHMECLLSKKVLTMKTLFRFIPIIECFSDPVWILSHRLIPPVTKTKLWFMLRFTSMQTSISNSYHWFIDVNTKVNYFDCRDITKLRGNGSNHLNFFL